MRMKIATVVIACLVVAAAFGAGCSKTAANGYPSVDEATSILNQAVAYAQARDLQGLGNLAQDESITNTILESIGGLQTVPNEPPQIVDTYVIPTVHLKSGSQATGGRVLVLEGRDGLDRPYHTEFMVFRAGSQLAVANVLYWDNYSITQCDEYGRASTATSPATPRPSATTVTSEHTFLPGEVLAGLPVYPGATPTTFLNSGSVPISVPSSWPAYAGSLTPGYQSASAQYTVQATEDDILSWYVNELGTKGYRKYNEGGFGGGTVSGRDMAFFLPSQPLVSVEVHIYDMPSTLVFELLVTYSVPLPKPPEEKLPDDIHSITVTYFSGVLPTVKILTDSQVVMQLASMVNALPVRPDYAYTGLLTSGGPQTIFSLVIHSQSKGDITVSDIIGCAETGIHESDYPILEDTHGLLREAVEQILGISST